MINAEEVAYISSLLSFCINQIKSVLFNTMNSKNRFPDKCKNEIHHILQTKA